MEAEQVHQDILQAKAQFEINESSSITNPLSHFRLRIVPDLKLNHFNRPLSEIENNNSEFDEIVRCAVTSRDWQLFKEILWFIKDEQNDEIRRSLILKYIRVSCLLTDEALNESMDKLLEYLHQDIETNWIYNIGFFFELLHCAGVNVEKLISLAEELKISNLFYCVELQWKLNNEDQTANSTSTNDIVQSIRRVFRLVLSLGYFQIEKLKSTLTDSDHLFFFLIGFYLQLDKRFQDINIIHLARRLMVNALTLLTSAYWNEKRDALVECLYNLSSKNVYITELFLKTNERTVRLRTQLALLHLKRLVNMIEHEKKSEGSILEEIIQFKLDPRQFGRQGDFIDCVRLLADIIDSYPYEQQIIYLTKLYERILPYVTKTHEKLLTDEQHLILFDDCERWETMLRPVLNETDYQKLIQRE